MYYPAGCLLDVVDNDGRIVDYLQGMDRSAFETDGFTPEALQRCRERIGEAVFDSAETVMPRHAWGDIRGMGDRLRHACDRISIDIVWESVTTRVPTLAADAQVAANPLRPPS